MADVYYSTSKYHDGYINHSGTLLTDNSADGVIRPGYDTPGGLPGAETPAFIFFPSVNVPQGAMNITATIKLTVTYSPSFSLRIYAHDVDSASAPTTASQFQGFLSNQTSAYTLFEGNGWTGSKYLAVGPIIQEIVSRSGWVSGNGILIILRTHNNDDQTHISSYEGNWPPDLTISYSVPQTYSESISDGVGANAASTGERKPAGFETVVSEESISDGVGAGDSNDSYADTGVTYVSGTFKPSVDAHDGYKRVYGSIYYPEVWGGQTKSIVSSGLIKTFFRNFSADPTYEAEHPFIVFDNVNIPAGATISSAKINLFQQSSLIVHQSCHKIYVAYADNADAPATVEDFDSYRSSAIGGVQWFIWTEAQPSKKTSPDISSFIQDVVNRVGWQSGNKILVILEPTSSGGKNTFLDSYYYSWESGESVRPYLEVSWEGELPYYEASITDGAGVRSRAVHDEQITEDSDTFTPTATGHDGYISTSGSTDTFSNSSGYIAVGSVVSSVYSESFVLIDAITIPPGSEINSATLKLYQTSFTATASPKVRVLAQLVSAATAPTNVSEFDTKLMSVGGEQVEWEIPTSGPDNWRLVDVTELVNRNINLTSWDGDSTILFFLINNGSPVGSYTAFCGYEGDPSIGTKPQLDVSWTREPVEAGDASITASAGMGDSVSYSEIGGGAGCGGARRIALASTADDTQVNGTAWSNSATDNYFGRYAVTDYVAHCSWRFTNISIPPGSIIISAKIKGAAKTSQTGYVDANIYCEDAKDPAAPTSFSDFEARDLTSRAINWVPEAWTSGTTYYSPELKLLVQDIIDREDWEEGDAIQFFVRNNNSDAQKSRGFVSYGYSGTPSFEVIWSANSGEYCLQVLDAADDCTWRASAFEAVTRFGGHWSTEGLNCALRYDNVPIPHGSKVVSAFITVKATETTSNNGKCKIYGDDSDDAPQITSVAEGEARPLTTAYTSWAPTSWTMDATYTTPDLKDIIQEILDRPGWVENESALQIIFRDNGSPTSEYRQVRSHSDYYYNQLYIVIELPSDLTYEVSILEEAVQSAIFTPGGGAYFLIVGRAGLSSSKLAGVANFQAISAGAGATVILADLAPNARISAGVGLQALLGFVDNITDAMGITAAFLSGINYSGTITSGTGAGEWIFHGDWYSETITDEAGATVTYAPGGANSTSITGGAGINALADYGQNLNRIIAESVIFVDTPVLMWLKNIIESIDFSEADVTIVSIPVMEWVGIGEDLLSRWSGSLSIAEQVTLLEATIIRWAQLVADSFASADSALSEVRVLVAEHLGITSLLSSRWAGSLSAQESLWLHEEVGRYLYIQDTVAESVAISEVVRLLMYGVVTETLQISYELTSTGQFNLANAETLALTEEVLPAFHMLLTDTLTNTDAVTLTWLFAALLADSVTLTDAAARIATLPETVAEELTAATTLSVAQILRQLVSESIHFDLSISLDGELWECWVLNTSQFLPSVFSGFDFNSFATHKGRVLGCKSDGVYELGAATDNGTAINAGIILPETTFGTSHRKRFRKAQFGISGTAPVIRVETENGAKTYNVTSARANMDRDIHGRDITVYVSGFDTLDFVELFPVVLAR